MQEISTGLESNIKEYSFGQVTVNLRCTIDASIENTQASSNFSASDQNISQPSLPYCCEDHFVSAYHVTPSVALSNSQDILGEVPQEIMSQMLSEFRYSSDTKRKQQFGLQRSVCKAAVEHASPEEFAVAVTASVFLEKRN